MGFHEINRSDAELAELVGGGDDEAFCRLMHRFSRTLYRVARSILKDDTAAQDAVQNSYMRAYRAMAEFRGGSSLSTWLVRIVINQSRSQLRSAQRRAEIFVDVDDRGRTPGIGHAGEADDVEDASAQPDTVVFRGQVRRLIEARIDQLPDVFRTVFVLRAIEEMSVEETAVCLDLPPATVRSRFFRARGLLRESLAREIDLGMETIFGFGGERCEQIAKHVLDKLNHERAGACSVTAARGGLHHEISI